MLCRYETYIERIHQSQKAVRIQRAFFVHISLKRFCFGSMKKLIRHFGKTKIYADAFCTYWASFQKCIREGVLCHYFIPTFNLLEVKLTRDAKRELLNLFDIVVQYDISIMSQCSSLVDVWSCFLRCRDNKQFKINQIRARRQFDLECILIDEVYYFHKIILSIILGNTIDSTNLHKRWVKRFEHIIPPILDLSHKNIVKSSLATFVLRELYCSAFKVQVYCPQQGNKARYAVLGNVFRNVNTLGNDISSSRLWCATFLQQSGKYSAALGLINNVLSAIPPYALYFSLYKIKSDVSKLLYKDTLLTRESNPINRAKQAWLFDIFIDHRHYNFMPSAH